MNARPKAVLGYVVGWLTTIGFVVLFTLIFNFVGTIICAALAGMMMGAARLRWWQSFLVSLVSPGVIAVAFLVTKAALPVGQILFLSALCFAIFWVIYFALWALSSHEHTASSKEAGMPTRVPPSTLATPLPFTGQTPPVCLVAAGTAASMASPALDLQMLQGTWLARNGSQASPHPQKALEISEDNVVLRLTDSQGHVQSLAAGHLRICAGCILAVIGKPGLGLDSETQVSI